MKVLRWVAGALAALALADSAVHLVPPYLAVSDGGTPGQGTRPTGGLQAFFRGRVNTLALARRFLVQPKERADFEWLAAQPVWSGVKLRVLLDHVELAGYNRELINWRLEDALYRDYVLWPGIADKQKLGKQKAEVSEEQPRDGAGNIRALAGLADDAAPGDGRTPQALDWRRALWEEFYPRIRHENSPEDAARIVLRHLHERVSIAALADAPRAVPDIWRWQITDAPGFEIISVAALRSVGVPARLNDRGQAEFWDGEAWERKG
jgi:hypothetical protein